MPANSILAGTGRRLVKSMSSDRRPNQWAKNRQSSLGRAPHRAGQRNTSASFGRFAPVRKLDRDCCCRGYSRFDVQMTKRAAAPISITGLLRMVPSTNRGRKSQGSMQPNYDEPMPFLGGGFFNSICPTKCKPPFHSLVRILLTPIAALVVRLAKHGWRTT